MLPELVERITHCFAWRLLSSLWLVRWVSYCCTWSSSYVNVRRLWSNNGRQQPQQQKHQQQLKLPTSNGSDGRLEMKNSNEPRAAKNADRASSPSRHDEMHETIWYNYTLWHQTTKRGTQAQTLQTLRIDGCCSKKVPVFKHFTCSRTRSPTREDSMLC